MLEHCGELGVVHFRQWRHHHQHQTDGERNVGGATGRRLDGRAHLWQEMTDPHPHRHRQEDPKREVAVEEGEATVHGKVARCITYHSSAAICRQRSS